MEFLRNIRSLNDLVNKVKEYQNQLLAIIGISFLLVGGFYGYSYYKQNREEKAYRTLVESLEYFNAPIKETASEEGDLSFLGKKEFKSEPEKWAKVAEVFEKAAIDHRGSGLAPIFLAYQSEALIQLGKLPEAIAVLRNAVNRMGSGEVEWHFSTKLGVMLLDTKNKEMVEEGLGILREIAADETSSAHDLALYHIGEYYWGDKQFKEAKNYWNQLLVKYGKSEKSPSPWATAAKEKLRLIDFDVE